MSATYPPLPPELAAFAETGVSILVGTCSADLAPDCVRGVGVRMWPDACHLTVLLPAVTAATSIANLAANPRLAVTLSQVSTYRTVQVKGRALAVREGGDQDRELALRYRALLTVDLAWVGVPNSQRLGIWPCHAVDLEIEVAFVQTPGPSAGDKLPLPASPR